MAGANVTRKPCVVDGCDKPIRSALAQYCEVHYYRLRRTGSLDVAHPQGVHDNCQYCGVPTKGKKHCSSRCSARAARNVPPIKVCVTCGQAFEMVHKRVTCSDACRVEYDRRMGREWYAMAMATRPEVVARVRASEYRRKARKLKAFVEEVERDEVMRRDRWRCHLCAQAIPKQAKWPDPLFGTVDHVLPLARGGAHSYANVRAAHLSCNCKKGAKPLGQLGLPLAG